MINNITTYYHLSSLMHSYLQSNGSLPLRQLSQGLSKGIIEVCLVSKLMPQLGLSLAISAEWRSCCRCFSFIVFCHFSRICVGMSLINRHKRLSKIFLFKYVLSHFQWLCFLLNSQLRRIVHWSLYFFSLIFSPTFAEVWWRIVYIRVTWSELSSIWWTCKFALTWLIVELERRRSIIIWSFCLYLNKLWFGSRSLSCLRWMRPRIMINISLFWVRSCIKLWYSIIDLLVSISVCVSIS